jgi:PAS domain-containing protein
MFVVHFPHLLFRLFVISDRQQLVQQMQLIGRGAHGAQAAAAVRHVAAQNGVWSLGNFGGVPPKSAMSFYEAPSNEGAAAQNNHLQDLNALQQHKVDPNEYRYVFNSCGAGMAIASMGGAFIDCNTLFCQLSNYTKQELCSLTIFNLTARHDLQQAFDQISRLISPPMDAMRSQERPNPIVVRGKMKDRDDLGLSISLVKGDDGIAKCFCVTLVKNPTSPFDTSKPVPVSFDSIRQQKESTTQAAAAPKSAAGMKTAPAFTSG